MIGADQEELVKTVIRGRTETYYLVTENDLNQIKSSSIFADIFFLICSLAFGLFMTQGVYITLITGLITLTISLFFYYSKYSLITKVKGSGEIQNLQVPKKSVEAFKIKKAVYGVPGRDKDITDVLQKMIRDEKLDTVASNALTPDPAPGTPKFLDIEYEHNGVKLTKRYNENDPVILP